ELSAVALLMDGQLYQQEVATRSGPHPWPQWMRHGVFSVTKTMGLGLSMLYLAQRYGDQVFEDLDHDGVFGAGEPGVPGVTVILTWAGPDGLIGTADDLTFTTVTDSSGQYTFDLLPAGGFLVELDDPTIPADLGVAPPVTLTLADAGTDMTADFPLVGNRPPVAVDDSAVTDEDTPVTID
ncbi:MAG: hypothetical protein GY773_11425, partial [Actinomycetia bacterium]|nr:hypothetical protein [Actinomycetes bacterium]